MFCARGHSSTILKSKISHQTFRNFRNFLYSNRICKKLFCYPRALTSLGSSSRCAVSTHKLENPSDQVGAWSCNSILRIISLNSDGRQLIDVTSRMDELMSIDKPSNCFLVFVFHFKGFVRKLHQSLVHVSCLEHESADGYVNACSTGSTPILNHVLSVVRTAQCDHQLMLSTGCGLLSFSLAPVSSLPRSHTLRRRGTALILNSYSLRQPL